MANLLDAAQETRQADELRSRANLLRQLCADELARDLEAITKISERKALAISRINLPTDTVLSDASNARRSA
jgi:hypothetical protein